MRRVVEWNGRDLPAALRELPPGRYSIDDESECSHGEREALRQLAARCADELVTDARR